MIVPTIVTLISIAFLVACVSTLKRHRRIQHARALEEKNKKQIAVLSKQKAPVNLFHRLFDSTLSAQEKETVVTIRHYFYESDDQIGHLLGSIIKTNPHLIFIDNATTAHHAKNNLVNSGHTIPIVFNEYVTTESQLEINEHYPLVGLKKKMTDHLSHLDMVKQLTGEIKNLLLITSENDIDAARGELSLLLTACKQLSIPIMTHTFLHPEQIQPFLESNGQKNRLVLILSNVIPDEIFETITALCSQLQMPLMTSCIRDLQRGATFGFQTAQQCSIQYVELISRHYLQGTSPEDACRVMWAHEDERLQLNEEKLNELGKQICPELATLMRYVDFKHESII